MLLGIDRLIHGEVRLPKHSKVGFLTNQAARSSDGRDPVLALRAAGYSLAFLLAPEHGLAGRGAAGDSIPHSTMHGMPVLSMYGADPNPVREAIRSADILLVDLPDVGCRYYTYPWTVRETLQLAAAAGRPVWILDRPNPLGGQEVEGNLPDPSFDSPVCAARVPVRHGLTLGELARYQALDLALDVDLAIVQVSGWRREMLWPSTGLPWVPPSPALVSFAATLIYPGTCLLEGTNISEGRGTSAPFELLGAPFVDSSQLVNELGDDGALAGARLTRAEFTPRAGKWAGQLCHGARLQVVDPDRFRPVVAGLTLLSWLCRCETFAWREDHFDALAGTSTWRSALSHGGSADEIAAGWIAGHTLYGERREPSLLYS